MTKHETDLSCKNCPDKKRCKEQQKKYLQNIDAILSYIRNSENEKYITELKNKITLPTRCDIVLEKELIKRTETLESIKEIIETRFKPETEYLSLGFKEYDEIIEDIDKIVSEVKNG